MHPNAVNAAECVAHVEIQTSEADPRTVFDCYCSILSGFNLRLSYICPKSGLTVSASSETANQYCLCTRRPVSQRWCGTCRLICKCRSFPITSFGSFHYSAVISP